MSARAVEIAIHRLRAMHAEMADVDPAHWLPEHTLHVYVDPILAALGWDPEDPEECLPVRPAAGSAVAGYILFAVRAGPHLAVLASSQSPTWSDLCPACGVQAVVITNGLDWELYNSGRPVAGFNVHSANRAVVAHTMHEWLGRSAW